MPFKTLLPGQCIISTYHPSPFKSNWLHVASWGRVDSFMHNAGLLLQALTSTDCKSRLSKQGKRFQQQLTERAALHELITAVQAGDAAAKLLLYGVTKVRTACTVQG